MAPHVWSRSADLKPHYAKGLSSRRSWDLVLPHVRRQLGDEYHRPTGSVLNSSAEPSGKL
jgi:hypothetical protein